MSISKFQDLLLPREFQLRDLKDRVDEYKESYASDHIERIKSRITAEKESKLSHVSTLPYRTLIPTRSTIDEEREALKKTLAEEKKGYGIRELDKEYVKYLDYINDKNLLTVDRPRAFKSTDVCEDILNNHVAKGMEGHYVAKEDSWRTFEVLKEDPNLLKEFELKAESPKNATQEMLLPTMRTMVYGINVKKHGRRKLHQEERAAFKHSRVLSAKLENDLEEKFDRLNRNQYVYDPIEMPDTVNPMIANLKDTRDRDKYQYWLENRLAMGETERKRLITIHSMSGMKFHEDPVYKTRNLSGKRLKSLAELASRPDFCCFNCRAA